MNGSILRLAAGAMLGMGAASSFAQSTQPASAPGAIAVEDIEAIVQRVLIENRAYMDAGSGSFSPAAVWRRQGAAFPGWIAPADVVQQSSCVLQIDTNRDMGASMGDSSTAAAILNTTLIQDAVISKVLKLDPEQRRRLVRVQANNYTDRFVRIEVTLARADVEYPANASDEIMWGLCDALKAALEQSAAAQRSFIEQRAREQAEELNALREQLAEVRAKVREAQSITFGLLRSNSDVASAMVTLRSQKQQYETELNRLRSRLRQAEPMLNSEVITEWESVVALRQSRLDELKKQAQNGAARTAEITETEAKLAEAKAQLANAKQAALDAAGRNPRSSEAASLRLQIADSESRVKSVEEQIARLEDPKVREIADQLPELQNHEVQLRNQITNLTSRRSFATRRDMEPVTWLQVTVLGSSGGRKPPATTQP